MASYMPQDVFDMCVVSAVKIHMVSGDSLGQVCSQICGYYKNSYPNDADFELEIKKTENGGDKLVHGSGGISQPRAE